MEVLLEIVPKLKMEKFEKELKETEPFDGYNIPDSPTGIPSPLPIVAATIIRERYGKDRRIIINQRLIDVNELYVRSLSMTAKMIDVEIAFTRGDMPKYGQALGELTSEKAVMIAKSYGIKAGMVLSLRKPRNQIINRLNFDADFFLTLRFRDVNDINWIERGIDRLIPYVIVVNEKTKELAEKLGQPYINVNEISDYITKIESSGIKSVIISTLGNVDLINEIIRRF
ncbi:MAG: hypothetical protein OWQ54_03895 [Sulfolobaceae archaeon]|nr:hypothetical protein [Sulfolobaceae archaeon]